MFSNRNDGHFPTFAVANEHLEVPGVEIEGQNNRSSVISMSMKSRSEVLGV
jgi:hypothetical protein